MWRIFQPAGDGTRTIVSVPWESIARPRNSPFDSPSLTHTAISSLTITPCWVGVVSNDFSVMGASSALVNLKKMKHVKDTGNKRGFPLVFLGESSGSRMPDRMGAQGRMIIAQDPNEYRRLRESPWVTAQLGDCYGSSTWYACMSDFVVMRKGATMAVASSRVTSMAINQPVSNEDLGGWRMHTRVSGLVDMAVDTDREALDVVKRFLSYLPANAWEIRLACKAPNPGRRRSRGP